MKHHGEMDAQAKKMGAKNASGDVARRQELQATKVCSLQLCSSFSFDLQLENDMMELM